MLEAFRPQVGWWAIIRRTGRELSADNALGIAAELSYYLFFSLFPAVLFLLALASFFPLEGLMDRLLATLASVAPDDVLNIIREQIQKISQGDHGGLLTFGVLVALWSSSAALVAVIGALNRAYDIEEGRPWWKVRLLALILTLSLALFILLALVLVLVGPTVAETLAGRIGLGPAFEWGWNLLQWPLVVALVAFAVGLLYYFAPDAEQDWAWITPGSVLATVLWLSASLAFKVYVANFGRYTETYGLIGGVMVLMLWFYLSSLAILVGAELNAEIEHAASEGKAPGEKSPSGRKVIGLARACAPSGSESPPRAAA